MPMYLYRCAECGAAHDHFARVSEIDTSIPECHGPMQRQLCAPMVAVQADICAASPIDGTPITSRRQRTEYMKRNGLQEALPAKEVIRKAQKRKQELQATAAKLPELPKHLQRQLYEQAGFPG